tara:strand:+ start:5322 stop:5867 length:546 start_codon:yes stop_codon:yes gene_type:complete
VLYFPLPIDIKQKSGGMSLLENFLLIFPALGFIVCVFGVVKGSVRRDKSDSITYEQADLLSSISTVVIAHSVILSIIAMGLLRSETSWMVEFWGLEMALDNAWLIVMFVSCMLYAYGLLCLQYRTLKREMELKNLVKIDKSVLKGTKFALDKNGSVIIIGVPSGLILLSSAIYIVKVVTGS